MGAITQKVFYINYGNPGVLVGLSALVLFCTFIAGAYPASVLSGFKASNAMKGVATGRKQKFNFRKALVVFQFGISTFLIIGALTIASQLKYLSDQKLGFNSDQVLVIPIKDTLMRKNYESTKTEFLKSSNIISASAVSNIPGKSFNQNPVRWKKDENVYADVSEYSVDHDFFETLGLNIIDGRSFSKNRKSVSGK